MECQGFMKSLRTGDDCGNRHSRHGNRTPFDDFSTIGRARQSTSFSCLFLLSCQRIRELLKPQFSFSVTFHINIRLLLQPGLISARCRCPISVLGQRAQANHSKLPLVVALPILPRGGHGWTSRPAGGMSVGHSNNREQPRFAGRIVRYT